MDKKRAIILPYKESFSDKNSGAASIFVKESLVNENIQEFVIYGSKSSVNIKYKKIISSIQFKKNILEIIII